MEHLLNENLLKYFTQYALQEGSTSALSIGGLKNLLQNQFAQYLKVSSTLIVFPVLPWNAQEKGNTSNDIQGRLLSPNGFTKSVILK